jgi:hypothetical protein
MAIGKLANIVRVRAMESTVALPITGDVVTIPADYVQTKNLKVTVNGEDYPLERKSLDLVNIYATRFNGTPCFFARDEGEFRLAPAPQSITEAELTYYREPDALLGDTDTNWFITNATEAVLFGSLWELGDYSSDEEFADRYKGRFTEEAIEVQSVEDKAEWSGGTLAINL